MKAIEVQNTELVWQDVEELAAPGPNEVRIDIRATAVNRADLSQRAGGYPPPPGASPILGLECAGIVEACGSNVSLFEIGDHVCALLAGGGYAERVIVPAGQVLPIPEGMGFAEAAAIPEVYATAYLNIWIEAAAQVGEKVLIHAGASGVGTAAVQMCKSFGNPCWITASGSEKIDFVKDLGAEGGTDRRTGDFVSDVRAWTNNRGVDVILDPVGGSYLSRNLQALSIDGRLVVIGLMGGASTELALGPMMVKRQRVIGSTLRARSVEAKTILMGELKDRVWPLFEAGLRPVIHKTMSIVDTNKAHELIASDQTIGKVVLEIPS